MRSFAAAREDRSWNGKHFATLFRRSSGGDQRSAATRRLDDDCAASEAGDDPVARWKIRGKRRSTRRELRDDQPFAFDAPKEFAVRLRIDDVDAGAEDGDRCAVGIERRFVCGGVDAASEAGDDDEIGVAREWRGDRLRGVDRVWRCTPRADDSDAVALQQLAFAARVKRERRIDDLAQQRRILLIDQCDDGRTQRFDARIVQWIADQLRLIAVDVQQPLEKRNGRANRIDHRIEVLQQQASAVRREKWQKRPCNQQVA